MAYPNHALGRSKADQQLTVQAARTQLSLLLASATDERVASFTTDGLARMYRIPPREVECMLLAAQAKRRREIAERG